MVNWSWAEATTASQNLTPNDSPVDDGLFESGRSGEAQWITDDVDWAWPVYGTMGAPKAVTSDSRA